MKTEFCELVKRSKNGDSDAFAGLYAEIYKELYYYALCNLNSSDDASDAVSDAVLDAFCGIKKLKNEAAFKSWMFKILTAKIKKKQSEYIKNRENTMQLDENYVDEKDNFNGIEILQQLDLLNEQEKLCFSLSVIGGYSSDEISEMTDIKPTTVRSSLSRGRQKLRSRLMDD